MTTQELIDFIKQQLVLGVSRETIQAQLLTQGWTVEDISTAFVVVTAPPSQPLVPPVPPASVTRHHVVPPTLTPTPFPVAHPTTSATPTSAPAPTLWSSLRQPVFVMVGVLVLVAVASASYSLGVANTLASLPPR